MDKSIEKKYNYWQWRTLIILMIGYLLFYFVRKNFSIIMPAMEQELGFSKAQLGIFLTLNGIIYGASRFVNGFLADRVSRKRLMALGLLASAAVNICIGASPYLDGVLNLLDTQGKATMGLVYLIGSLWLINGYAQGMGYPPCASLMAYWFKPSELSTKQSIWNSSHSIGAGVVSILCGFILGRFTYSAWQWCFYVPALLAILGALLLYFGLKDTPSSVGLPDPTELDENAPVATKAEEESPERKERLYKAFLSKMVFGNPVIWILAVTNFCVYVIRFTILDWGSTFLTQYKGLEITTAANVVAASEIVGGIIGTLLAGWATDKFFSSKAQRTCLIGVLGATVSFFLFWKVPSVNLSIIFLILSSFFIYAPQALLGIAASLQATKRAAASANGLLGIFGYASTTVSGIIFGILADKSWDNVFMLAIGFGVIGTLVIAALWSHPSDGYAKAHKIEEETE